MVSEITPEVDLTADYSKEAIAILQNAIAQEKSLNLIDETCFSRFLLHPKPTQKVILFFHGFTAVPQQFVPIGEFLHQAGYNVVIPLLPGHGLAGAWNEKAPPPLPESTEPYYRFARHWFNHAREFGQKVVVGGLSGGSTLAAWLSLEEPGAIAQSLLFAPFLRNPNRLVDCAVKRLNFYFRWRPKPGVTMFGYEGFYMPALRVFLEMGQEILNRVQTEAMSPLLLVSSESDRATSKSTNYHLFQSALKHQPNSWHYCFQRQLDVPHNMMTEVEGNTQYQLVYQLTKAFVENNIYWLRMHGAESAFLQNESIKG